MLNKTKGIKTSKFRGIQEVIVRNQMLKLVVTRSAGSAMGLSCVAMAKC